MGSLWGNLWPGDGGSDPSLPLLSPRWLGMRSGSPCEMPPPRIQNDTLSTLAGPTAAQPGLMDRWHPCFPCQTTCCADMQWAVRRHGLMPRVLDAHNKRKPIAVLGRTVGIWGGKERQWWPPDRIPSCRSIFSDSTEARGKKSVFSSKGAIEKMGPPLDLPHLRSCPYLLTTMKRTITHPVLTGSWVFSAL